MAIIKLRLFRGHRENKINKFGIINVNTKNGPQQKNLFYTQIGYTRLEQLKLWKGGGVRKLALERDPNQKALIFVFHCAF